ncbi:MAG TPA: hypothetical protein VN922_22135 [Bacteroidia bacterium]|nr:hypothetical protein [Bacteroidia bacterium]
MSLIREFRLLPSIQRITIVLSLILLLISFSQPAFYVGRPDYDAWSNSLLLFLLGWMGILGGGIPSCLIWLANPLYLISIYFIIKGKSFSVYLALAGTLLALCFLFMNSILTSESGQMSKITVLKSGYILWLISISTLFIGTVLSQFKKKSSNS